MPMITHENVESSEYNALNDSFEIVYKNVAGHHHHIIIQRDNIPSIRANGKRISWEKFRYIFKGYSNNIFRINIFSAYYTFNGYIINFEYKEDSVMKEDMEKLLETIEELDKKRKYWMEKYEKEHKRAKSLDKKHVQDIKKIKGLEEKIKNATTNNFNNETSIKALKSRIRDLEENNLSELKERKFQMFKRELGDILGISKNDSYPEFVKEVKRLKERADKVNSDFVDARYYRKLKRSLAELLDVEENARDCYFVEAVKNLKSNYILEKELHERYCKWTNEQYDMHVSLWEKITNKDRDCEDLSYEERCDDIIKAFEENRKRFSREDEYYQYEIKIIANGKENGVKYVY